MSFIIIIPARYHSTRLPKKLLADIGGKPMLERTFNQAIKSDAKQVIIATDDERIAQVAQKFTRNICLTSQACHSGTQRIIEVIKQQNIKDDTIIVNVQGDEPLLPSVLINQVANDLANHPSCVMATLCEPIIDFEQYQDENCVKVLRDNNNHALYFSRAPVPYFRNKAKFTVNACYRHIGLYAYRAGFLTQQLPQTISQYEQAEKLEQLSVLYNGHKIYVANALCNAGVGIDTQADLDKVRQYFIGKNNNE